MKVVIDKKFHEKILKLINDCTIIKEKKTLAMDLYLNYEIILLEANDSFLLYNIDNKQVKVINKENGIMCNVDGTFTIKNEYLYACILAYKRDYYIENKKKFDYKDVISHTAYYFSSNVNAMNYDDFQFRFTFYYGLIDKLVKFGEISEAIKMMLDFFCFIETNLSYDNNVNSNEIVDQYNIVRNRIELFVENAELVPSLFNVNDYSILCLGKFMYIIAINNPNILKNKSLDIIYQYVLSSCTKKQQKLQLYELLNRQAKIIKWYNNELDDDFMRENIDAYDVLYCYVNYLDLNKRYDEIREIYTKNKFKNNTQNILWIGINSFYTNNDYETALSILLNMESITFRIYKSLKERFPNLFTDQYLDKIIEHIASSSSYQEGMEIVNYENKEKYSLIVNARENFNIVDEKFNEYIGKYDDILLKIYQKEVVNRTLHIYRYYNHIPEEIFDLLEKMKKMKNGKYYIVYTIYSIMKNKWMPYKDELIKYSKGLLV